MNNNYTLNTPIRNTNFGQSDPVWFCPKRHDPIFEGRDAAGKPYRRKHRCPRCSKECHDAWAGQEHWCVVDYLRRNLPAGSNVYTGHLHLPPGATVQNHDTTRKRFIHAVRLKKCQLRKKYPNLTLELRAYTHATGPDEQHYDYLAYSTLPQEELRRHLRRLWVNAGGRGDISTVHVPEGYEIDVVGYLAKSRHKYRQRFYLSADNLLDFVWGTRFFIARSKTTVWEDLCLKWHPSRLTPLDHSSISVKAHREQVYTRTQEQELIAALEEVERQQPYRDEVDRDCIRRVLGKTPVDGIAIDTIAHRSGCPASRVVELLPTIPAASTIDGWKDGKGVLWNTSGYFLPAHDATPQEWQELSDYAATVCDLVGMDHAHCVRTLARTEFGC